MDKTVMTLIGKLKLEKELKKLIQKDRPEVIKAIEEARAHGDLSENAEYSAAKEQQGFIEGRIAELKGMLATAQVIDPTKLPSSNRVAFSATIQLENQETGEEKTYQVVGIHEADIKQGKISYKSPFARKLIGKSEGDIVEHSTPKGDQVWLIKDVQFR